MDIKELEKIVKFCRKQGVLSLKIEGIEISLSQTALFPEKPHKEAPTADHIPTEGTFTEEDALFWSSAGIPEPQSGAQ